MNQQSYTLKWYNHQELIKKFEENLFEKTGVKLEFEFELASDGNTDLFIKEHKYAIDELNSLIEAEWLEKDLVFNDEFVFNPFDCPFGLHEDTLAHSHQLFQFVLEKTFGEGAQIAGIREDEEHVHLNVARPVQRDKQMKRYLITGNSYTSTLVADEEFNGCEVVIAIYDADDKEQAKNKAVQEYKGLSIEELVAYEIK